MYIAELREASKLFPVLFLLISIEINLQYTHTHPNSVSNQPTSSHGPPGLVLASFKWGAWFFLFCFTWKPSPFHSEIRVWPQIPYLGWKSLLTWCLGIERGMRWKNWSSFSGNFFPWFLKEVEEYFSSLSSLKQ